MMQFLKSILSSRKTDNQLKKDLEEASAKIKCLEEEAAAMTRAINEITICVSNLVQASHVLSQDMAMITSVIQATFKAKSSENHFKSYYDTDDDDYLN